MVKVNDQIVEVDGRSLHGYTNQEAVEMLRSTGNIVRYHGHTLSLPLDV
jgi:multiple PDZ domain protein